MPGPVPTTTRSTVDEWFTPKRFAALLALLTCLSFPDVVFGGGTFFHRDFAIFGYPLAFYQRECFWQGELPLWNPLNYCGLPFLAQWNTMTLYPPALFYLLLPLSWSLGVFCLAHLFFAGMGMYFLAFRWTMNRFAAAVAGVSFSFTALMLNFLMWPNDIAGMAWMPWVVLAVERAWREGGRALLVATLAGSLQMLAGAPEIIMQTWGFLFILLAGECVRQFRSQWRLPVRFALVVLLVSGLCAAQLFPFLDLLRHSHRDTAFADSTWSMPLWGWANFLVPLFRAGQSSFGLYAQPDQYWVFSYYLGIGAAGLAVMAALQGRQSRAHLLAILTLLCLVLALGERGLVYSIARKVLPVLGFMRFPVKLVVLPALLVPLLAGFSVRQCLEATADWPRLRWRMIATAIGLAVIVGLIMFWAFQSPFEATSSMVAVKSGLSRILFLGFILAVLAAMRRATRKQAALLLRGGMLLLLWLDVMTMGPRPNPTVDRSVYEPGLVRREARMTPVPQIGESRPMLSAEASRNVNLIWFTNAMEQVLYSRLALAGNLNLLDGIPKLVGSYSLALREVNDVLSELYGPPQPPPGLADFLAISHVNAPGKATEWVFRPTHLPWVTGGQMPIFAEAEATLAVLTQPAFDPRHFAFLPPEARASVTVARASAPAITKPQFFRQKVTLEVEAAEPALIVIAQSYYHNWRAFVDEKAVPLLRANHAFQALQVPGGRHQVKLVYTDKTFEAGAVVSLVTLAGSALFWFRSRKRKEIAAQ